MRKWKWNETKRSYDLSIVTHFTFHFQFPSIALDISVSLYDANGVFMIVRLAIASFKLELETKYIFPFDIRFRFRVFIFDEFR